jgi:hypothetical protein
MINSVGRALSVSTMAAQAQPRYRINIGANITNLLNRPQYSGFSGIITSPYFLQPRRPTGSGASRSTPI